MLFNNLRYSGGQLFKRHFCEHGNADNAVNKDGSPNTAHSLNPVPFILVSDKYTKVKDGILADVAPTILEILGLSQPSEMTGKVLME